MGTEKAGDVAEGGRALGQESGGVKVRATVRKHRPLRPDTRKGNIVFFPALL